MQLLITLAAGVAAFVLLLVLRRTWGIATLAAANIAGALGLLWFVAQTLHYDGVMMLELLLSAAAIAVLAGITAGGLTLDRHGKAVAAHGLLAITAVPTFATFGFLFYLDANPIDWR